MSTGGLCSWTVFSLVFLLQEHIPSLSQLPHKEKIYILVADNMRHQQPDPVKSSRLLSEVCVTVPPL